LLWSDLAKDVPQASLQEIFYNACSHAKVDNAKTNDVEVLKISAWNASRSALITKLAITDIHFFFVAVDSDDVETR